MQDPSRSSPHREDGDTQQGQPESSPARGPVQPRVSTPPPSTPAAKPYVGNAMKALFESSDVSIRRGDETRVMSRAQEALAEIQRKSGAPPAVTAPASGDSVSPSSRPPAPRVDAVLWIVLALGLFAIAGWMVAYAL